MVRIEVTSTQFVERAVNGRKGTFIVKEQGGYAYTRDEQGKEHKYPVQVKLPLEETQPPYQPGLYTLDPRCVYVGDFNKLALGRVKLIALPKAGA